MMDRRRRAAAARVQQRRTTDGAQQPQQQVGSSSSSLQQTEPEKEQQRQEDVPPSTNNNTAVTTQRRTKRDLLARSRRSLSEPHRRFASPPSQRTKNCESSPRATQAASEIEPSTKPPSVDARERRVFLKSKAKQMVSQRAKQAVETITVVAETVQSSPLKTLASPRRIVDRKIDQAKLHSKAKAVMAQRKKPTVDSPAAVEPFMEPTAFMEPPVTQQTQTRNHMESLMEPKPKSVPKQQLGPTKLVQVANEMRQTTKQTKPVEAAKPVEAVAQPTTASATKQQQQPLGPTKLVQVANDLRSTTKQKEDAAKPVESLKPVEGEAKPLAKPITIKPVETSFLHKKAALHKQQRDLMRRKPSTDNQSLTEELTAILSSSASQEVSITASVDEPQPDEEDAGVDSHAKNEAQAERKPMLMERILQDDGNSAHDDSTLDRSLEQSEESSVQETTMDSPTPSPSHNQESTMDSPTPSPSHTRKDSPKQFDSSSPDPSWEHIVSNVPESTEHITTTASPQSSPAHKMDSPVSSTSTQPLEESKASTEETTVSTVESPTMHSLLGSPKQDLMERIRAEEPTEPKLPSPVNTSFIDKTVASRLDSPEKKPARPFRMFDLIEIQSTEDEDHLPESTTPPSMSVGAYDSPATEAAAIATNCSPSTCNSPATEAAAIASESPIKAATTKISGIAATDSLDEILATPKELDFRPLPTPESAIVDSSWDANKVFFNEYVGPEKRESSWTNDILPKESDKNTSAPLVAPVQDADMDPLGWPRSPDGLESKQQDSLSQQSEKEGRCDDNAEENLLLVKKSSSDDMDDDYLLASAKSKEERIREYDTRERDEESTLEEDSEDSDDEEIEIGYVSQESETEDGDLLDDENDLAQRSNPRTFFPDEIAPAGSEDNPIQIPVVLDLSNTDLQPAETLSADDLDSLLASSVGDCLSPRSLPDTQPTSQDNDLLPPPPPPPPPKSKKQGKTVPLLAPPPEEKLARWASSRGNKNAAGMSRTNATVASLLDSGNEEDLLHDDGDRQVLTQRNQEDAPYKETNDESKKGCKKKRPKSRRQHAEASSKRSIFPESGESPFDRCVREESIVLKYVLDFLGDPVAVCRTKMLNKNCQIFVRRSEHTLMRDAVRIGGMKMNVRPYFWLWVTLEKAGLNDDDVRSSQLRTLEKDGREGKWSHVIERDVSRAFGNLPPHKSGARLRTDSIVRALVSWGKSRVVKNGVRGSRDVPTGSADYESDGIVSAPTDTVSDWGGVTPVGSFGGSVDSENEERGPKQSNFRSRKHTPRADEMALSGNTLSEDMKTALQHKLSFILHALASWNRDVGYCQGMDYIVAHLLRILQDTIRWKAANGTLPSVVENKPTLFGQRPLSRQALQEMYAEVDRSLVVEETCFRVMNTFFTTYSLEHFYWPELRCLKTCCRVFEKLVKIKLPVLADHFEHHELNVGLFALGWFQTLFLYLPSMPSATVCHMWDIWLVERSFKIFFRVGTAILFLSQPQLLNCELDGMMSYLNTFPDATLLSPDILIACALQIKVTNKMLMELEEDVKRTTATC